MKRGELARDPTPSTRSAGCLLRKDEEQDNANKDDCNWAGAVTNVREGMTAARLYRTIDQPKKLVLWSSTLKANDELNKENIAYAQLLRSLSQS